MVIIVFLCYCFRYSPKAPPNIKIPCQHYSTAYRCTSLTKKDIIKFHNAFYSTYNKIDQDNFILQHSKVSSIQRRRLKSGTGNKKNISIVYYVRRRNCKIPVCRSTFLSILGLKKGRVNGVVMRNFKSNGATACENRGGNRKEKKFAGIKISIKNFIKKLVPLEIHYCRGKIKCRQYLATNLSIAKLYKMYISETEDQFKSVKQSYFRRIFNTSFNIGFGSPATDVCSTCLTLDEKIKREKDANKKKDILITKRVHNLRAKAFYNLLKEEKENLLTLSFDCQKNQPMPKVPDQRAYYSRQLYTYNFTIVVGSSKSKLSTDNVFIYTWTEDVLPKASNEIASALFHCLCANVEKNEKATTIRLMADGCSGQNKNTSVLGMLCKYLMDYAPERVKTVELIFPIVGHSFLPPDRVFAQIEKLIKKTDVIPNPKSYIEFFKQRGTVLNLGTEIEVLDWKTASNEVLKSTSGMHFSIKESKRFIIKRNKQKSNVLVRAESSYRNTLGTSKNICKRNKKASQINPCTVPMNIAIKKEKMEDVKKLLIAHYGEDWEDIPELDYFKYVFSRPDDLIQMTSAIENCEMEEELPSLII